MLTSPNHPTKPDISNVRENKYLSFSFFLFKKALWVLVLPTVQMYPHSRRFLRFCPIFVYEKTETKREFVYII